MKTKNRAFAVGAVLLMCMTAFAFVNLASEESDAASGTYVYPGDSFYAINSIDTAYSSYSKTGTLLELNQFGGVYVQSGAAISVRINDEDGAECSNIALDGYAFFSSCSSHGLTGTVDGSGVSITGNVTATVIVKLNYFDYYDESSNRLQFTIAVVDSPLTETYDCQGTYDSTNNLKLLPYQMYYATGSTIDLTVDCECGDGITYSWSPSAPGGISIVNANSAYPFYIRGTWQTAGTYTLHTDCNEVGCVNDVTFIVTGSAAYAHTVTYAANGGSGSMSDTVVTDQTNGNSNVTLASNGFTRSGYSFTGWKIGNTVYQPGQTVSVEANATVTATAQWSLNTLTIGGVAQQYVVKGAYGSFTATCSSDPSGTSVTYSASNVPSGLSVNISGSTITYRYTGSLDSNNQKDLSFTLVASASGYSVNSTMAVNIHVVAQLAFTNTPSAGVIGS